MDAMMQATPGGGELGCERVAHDTLCLRLAGTWSIHTSFPGLTAIQPQLEAAPPLQRLTFDAQALRGWDSTLVTFLLQLQDLCTQRHIAVDWHGLPPGVQRLLTLARVVPERQGARREITREGLFIRLGKNAIDWLTAVQGFCTFLGQLVLACGQLLRGRAGFRRVDFLLILQECGAQALLIVALISFLVGLILAFVGATQLRQFGAQIYVANLVGLGMVREMGAMMTGIIMAGRTGAAFAAQLGTMTVNQEIDALLTLGLSPMQFLVLPRVIALVLMVPLLCVYADIVGILGGAVIGMSILDIGPVQYYQQTLSALHLRDFAVGFIKGAVFGVIVALAGCLRGLQCGRSASAVGVATTSAVVTAIVWIIVFDALLTVIYDVLGI